LEGGKEEWFGGHEPWRGRENWFWNGSGAPEGRRVNHDGAKWLSELYPEEAKKQKRSGVPGKIALPPEHPKPLKPIKD